MMGPYPAYKDSGVEWIGEIPEDWELKPLKYVVGINQSTLTEKTDEIYELQYIDIGNVTNLGLINPPKKMKFGDSPSRARRIVKNGDTIISTVRTYLKAFAYIESDTDNLIASTGFAVLTHSDQIYPKYLYYLISNQKIIDTISSLSVGVSYPAVNSSELGSIPIWYPKSIGVQKQIANFLDHKTQQIDTLLEKKQKQIELLKEQRTAVINQAVTKGLDPNVKMKDSGIEWLGEIPEHWDKLKIKRLTRVKRGASPRPIDNPKYFDDDGEFSWVRIADVTASKRYLEKTTQKLSSLGSSLSVKQYPGDFFVSIAGTVGKPIITKINCCIHDGFVWFPDLIINREFLYYIFSGGELYRGLGKLGTQLNLNTETIGDIHIALPPTDELEVVIKYLDDMTNSLDSLITMIEKQISLLKEYRTTLISEAVSGKIDVRNWRGNEK